MAAFLVWLLCGLFFVGFGVYACGAKKKLPFGFWANAETFPVRNVRAYNKALGILYIVFGVVFGLTGMPLLGGQNSPLILISVLGAMFEAIVMMVVYVTVIERKYREQDE